MVTHARIGDVDNRYALSRLAGKAKADGIKLFRDRSGRYFASSASKPGTLHYVTGYSCDCQGFATHGRCKHHAALMASLGWVDPTPEPTPPASAVSAESAETSPTCPACNGKGEIHDTELFRGRYCDIWLHCTRCSGTGTAVAA